MTQILSLFVTTPIFEISGHPASCVFVPREVFQEYHLKAFDCTVIGEFLEITRFVIQDKGKGHGSRLLSDLNEWAKGRGLRLCLSPIPYADSSEEASRRLIAFYKRHGFVEIPEGVWCPAAMSKASLFNLLNV